MPQRAVRPGRGLWALSAPRAVPKGAGTPTAFVQTGKPRLRGGFVNRSYRVTYAGTTLSVSTYAEPGPNGKLEQLLVTPTQP